MPTCPLPAPRPPKAPRSPASARHRHRRATAPNTPMARSALRSRGRSPTDAVASASSAMMPPSPRLLALKHQRHVLERHDDHQRPEDRRHAAEDVHGRQWNAVLRIERFLGGVQRARADVAVDDAQGKERKRRRRLLRFRNGGMHRYSGFGGGDCVHMPRSLDESVPTWPVSARNLYNIFISDVDWKSGRTSPSREESGRLRGNVRRPTDSPPRFRSPDSLGCAGSSSIFRRRWPMCTRT